MVMEQREVLEKYLLNGDRYLELQSKRARGENLTPEEQVEIFRHMHAQNQLNTEYLKDTADYTKAVSEDLSAILERLKKRDEENKTVNADTILKTDNSDVVERLTKLVEQAEKPQKTVDVKISNGQIGMAIGLLLMGYLVIKAIGSIFGGISNG